MTTTNGSELEPELLAGIETTDPAVREAFFAGAARLFRAAPWSIASTAPICVTIEARGIDRAIVTILGEGGSSFAFIVLRTMEDYDALLAVGDFIAAGKRPRLPPQLALQFEREAEVAEAHRDEIARHGWALADKDAYPWVHAVDKVRGARTPTPDEVAKVMVIAEALSELMEGHRAEAVRFFDGAEPVLTVESSLGRLIFEDAEYVESLLDSAPIENFDPRMDLFEDAGELDRALLDRYELTILARFAASPEAGDYGEGPDWLGAFMLYLALYRGRTVATMAVADLDEVVFELFPRKLVCKASDAAGIMDQLRRFMSFLKREYGLENVDECLAALGEDATKDLERVIVDSARPNVRRMFGFPLAPAPRAQTKAPDRAKKKNKKKQAKASKRKNR